MNLLHWFFLMGAAFRITRFITTDDLTKPFRTFVESRTGSSSNWATLINCNWCVGIYITTAVFCEYTYLSVVPLWIYALLTAAAAVGFIGNYDD